MHVQHIKIAGQRENGRGHKERCPADERQPVNGKAVDNFATGQNGPGTPQPIQGRDFDVMAAGRQPAGQLRNKPLDPADRRMILSADV